jgi:hypothetical protein
MSNASSAPPLTPIAQSAAVIIGDVLRFAAGQAHTPHELQLIRERLTQLQAAVADAEGAAVADAATVGLLSSYPAAAEESFHVIHDEMQRWGDGSVSKLGLARLQQHCRALAQLAHEAQQQRPELSHVA